MTVPVMVVLRAVQVSVVVRRPVVRAVIRGAVVPVPGRSLIYARMFYAAVVKAVTVLTVNAKIMMRIAPTAKRVLTERVFVRMTANAARMRFAKAEHVFRSNVREMPNVRNRKYVKTTFVFVHQSGRPAPVKLKRLKTDVM